VVLASASSARRMLLQGAGVPHACEPAGLDERSLRTELAANGVGAEEVALALAEAKAVRVSRRRGPGDLVIGADQILDCEGVWLEKPAGAAEAREQLRRLRGRAHRLACAAAAARGGAVLWRHREAATLRMRLLSDAFLDAYLEQAGPAILESVGAYRLEGLGVQLFERIEGDYFAILGLPLLPLLAFLRREGVLGE
jgi:septum formation protein